MYKRDSVIRSHLLGMANNKIAELEMIVHHTIGTYVNKHYKGGLDGLIIKYDNYGYERKLSRVKTVINKFIDEIKII